MTTNRPLHDQQASGSDSAPQLMTYTCDICLTEMYDFHCRIICPNCGYQRDCSDP